MLYSRRKTHRLRNYVIWRKSYFYKRFTTHSCFFKIVLKWYQSNHNWRNRMRLQLLIKPFREGCAAKKIFTVCFNYEIKNLWKVKAFVNVTAPEKTTNQVWDDKLKTAQIKFFWCTIKQFSSCCRVAALTWLSRVSVKLWPAWEANAQLCSESQSESQQRQFNTWLCKF